MRPFATRAPYMRSPSATEPAPPCPALTPLDEALQLQGGRQALPLHGQPQRRVLMRRTCSSLRRQRLPGGAQLLAQRLGAGSLGGPGAYTDGRTGCDRSWWDRVLRCSKPGRVGRRSGGGRGWGQTGPGSGVSKV